MDEFSYLSVLLSVVIGLAVAEILQGFRSRIIAAERVQSFWPVRVWSVTMLLVCAQTWWAMFGLRSRHAWTFDQFLVLLGQVIVLYLACGILYPEFGDKNKVDMRAHYFAQRKRLFAFLLIGAVLSISRDLVLNHAWPDRLNLAFHGLWIVTVGVAILTANEWYHKALALFTAFAFVNYITTLFVKLQ